MAESGESGTDCVSTCAVIEEDSSSPKQALEEENQNSCKSSPPQPGDGKGDVSSPEDDPPGSSLTEEREKQESGQPSQESPSKDQEPDPINIGEDTNHKEHKEEEALPQVVEDFSKNEDHVTRSNTTTIPCPVVVHNKGSLPNSSAQSLPENASPSVSTSESVGGSTSSDALADDTGALKSDRLSASVNSNNLVEDNSGTSEEASVEQLRCLNENATNNSATEVYPCQADEERESDGPDESASLDIKGDGSRQDAKTEVRETKSPKEHERSGEADNKSTVDNSGPRLHRRNVGPAKQEEGRSAHSGENDEVPAAPVIRERGRCRTVCIAGICLMVLLILLAATLYVYYVDESEVPEAVPAEVGQLSLSVEKLREHTPKPQLKILMVGKHGIGKRTLIAELFGERQRQECSNDNRVPSSDTICDKFNINGVSINVMTLDSAPILNTRHITALDLVVFSIRMDDTRYRGDDEEILRVLSRKSSGSILWSKGIIAMTFANRVTFVHPETGKEEQSKEHLMKKAEHWKDSILGTLRNEGVLNSVLNDVPFVPVGHPSLVQLYDNTESWKTSLIKCMIIRLKESGMDASAAMWQVMKDSIQFHKGEPAIKCEW